MLITNLSYAVSRDGEPDLEMNERFIQFVGSKAGCSQRRPGLVAAEPGDFGFIAAGVSPHHS